MGCEAYWMILNMLKGFLKCPLDTFQGKVSSTLEIMCEKKEGQSKKRVRRRVQHFNGIAEAVQTLLKIMQHGLTN